LARQTVKENLMSSISRPSISRRLLLALAVASAAPHLAAQPAREPIRLGQVNLSFYAVTGGVVQEVLERSAQPFVIVEGSHGDIYPKLGTGEIDILAASWLPNAHAGLYAKVKDQTFLLSKLYDDAKLYIAVPDTAPASVRSVADLAKPEIAAQFDKTILSIGASSGLSIGAAKMMESYGLKAAGYEFKPGEARDWIANFRKAVDEKRHVVMPLWQPQWLNATYKVRVLADPQKVFGDGDQAFLVARNDLSAKLRPEVLERLKRVALSVEAVTEMDRMVNVDKLSPREAARRWIAANPAKTADWFPKAID
jgi:glycine betaine/proline transport system substrate-binding protein